MHKQGQTGAKTYVLHGPSPPSAVQKALSDRGVFSLMHNQKQTGAKTYVRPWPSWEVQAGALLLLAVAPQSSLQASEFVSKGSKVS